MASLKHITYQDIEKAIKYISENGFPEKQKSKRYDFEWDGELYPLKYIISKAGEFSSNKRYIYSNEFVTRDAQLVFKKLELDGRIRQKDKYYGARTLDDLVHTKKSPTKDDLRRALKRLDQLSPERKKKIIEVTDREDTALIKVLKNLYENKCQMPGCRASIKKKDGTYYCEVAHIVPFSEIQTSTADNLIVLCPNHHKEFDLGDKQILVHNKQVVKGVLNGIRFEFLLRI